MVVLNKNGFKLPRVEREKFILLIRLGLDYNSQKMLFSIKNYNNMDKLRDALQEILKSEVVFTQTCVICGTDFGCAGCKYAEFCSTKDLPFTCVCPKCLKGERAVSNTGKTVVQQKL
jgi:hypothetical protein